MRRTRYQILIEHAKGTGYTNFTSTLEEAWRASIRGLNLTFQETVQNIDGIPEHRPDKDYANDRLAAFGVLEARLHRSRGITLSMFLGLMKYYRQAYIDCVRGEFTGEKGERFRTYVDRVFEHIEIGFITEWITSGEPKLISELQGCNRAMTNEKNLYLTIFESMPEPVAILDERGEIITVNHPYSKAFLGSKVPGDRYYGEPATIYLPMQIAERIQDLLLLPDRHGQFQAELESANGRRSYLVQTTKMLDISEKYQGMIVIFNEVTERERMMHELVLANEKIRLLGEMTRHDVLNLLTIINGNLQLLEMKAANTDRPTTKINWRSRTSRDCWKHPGTTNGWVPRKPSGWTWRTRYAPAFPVQAWMRGWRPWTSARGPRSSPIPCWKGCSPTWHSTP
ncbi:MAG: PAS domain-containing protein [Methanomassiliicoccales archaeon]